MDHRQREHNGFASRDVHTGEVLSETLQDREDIYVGREMKGHSLNRPKT